MNNKNIQRTTKQRISLKLVHRLWACLFVVLFQALAIVPLYAQDLIKVTGTVTNAQGESLPGVNVVIDKTTKGTITDIDGNFSLSVGPNETLKISFIGFITSTVPVRGRTTINVVLQEDTKSLDEVVVVGYGEVKRANLLGSVASMSSKEIEDIPVANITNLLEGRLAGVYVAPAQPTGNPGASTRVRIRSETTFGLSGGGPKDPTPLYVIDGFEVEQDEYEMLDASEVESISVLKDASAAVYGSKGANGVVLVKTKRGREGKLQVNYSGSHGLMDATQQTEMLSAYDHARMLNARYKDDATFTQLSDTELEKMKSMNYDWLDMAWQMSSISRHSVNISGGSERLKYYGGGTYVYTEGNFPELGVGKYTYRIGLDATIADGLTASVTASIDNRDHKQPYMATSGSNTMEDMFQELLQAPKWTPPFIDGKPVANNLSFNPMALFNSNSYKRDVDKGNTINLKMNYKFKKVDGLNASVSYSRRESHSYNKQYRVPYDLYYFDPAEESQYILSNKLRLENPIVTKQNSNQISESYSYGENYQLNTTLSYSKKFGLHNINSFLTYEQSESEGYSFSAKSETMLIRGIETQKAFDYNKAVADGGMSESGRLGGVGRINYSYADRYLLEAAGRYEGTTKFAPGKRMGFFPSVALGWVMSEEAFMKDRLSFINFLKLRGSFGVTGYASVGAYEYLLRFGPSGTYLFGGGSAASGMGVSGKTDVVSSGVSWEKSNMFNGGIDLKVLDSRLGVSIDGFFTRQTDILDSRSVEFPQTSGIITMPSENIGELIAWGYDADISYNGAIGRDFKWYVKGIFNFSANKILERPTDRKPNDFRYPIGQSTFAVGREEGYIDQGIIRSQEQLDAINAEWRAKWGRDYRPFGNVAEVGMLYYQDIGRPGIASAGEPETVFEPDGIINQVNDKTYVQRVNDHFVWQNLLPTSVSMGGSWRDFSFSMLFTMAYGTSNQVVDKLARTVPDKTVSSPAFWSDFWSPDNINGAYPHPKFASFNQLVSTFWMKDVKQLRLKTLNISYNVPKNVSKKIGIPELRLYFVGTNLWSPITTFDYKEDAIARYNTYPLLRTFSLGVNVKL